MRHLRQQRPHALIAGILGALMAATLLTSFAFAGTSTTRHTHSRARRHVAVAKAPAVAPRPAAVATAGQGMVVGIDPQTGRLGAPTPEQMSQLSASDRSGLMRAPAALTATRLANGTLMINLQGQFMEYSVLRLDADGRPQVGCVDDANALSRWLDPGTALPTPVLEVK